MATVLYLDCFSGISGDMVLGAFLDAGLPLADLRGALGSLALDGVEIHAERVLRAGVSATKCHVVDREAFAGPHVHRDGQSGTTSGVGHGHRSLKEIIALVNRSALSASGKARVEHLFHRLATAEAAIHQLPVDDVHLHEVGAVDSIVDIVGAVFAMEWANPDRVECSALNVGGGSVESAHGRLPVPAPATLRLLEGAPVYSRGPQRELVTPTGALLATDYASRFGPLPALTVRTAGYGAGSRDDAEGPNVLRIVIGESADAQSADRVVVIECEIDDMNPQLFGVAMDRLYDAGALEVFYVAAQMKKNRPGTLLTVLAAPAKRQALTEIVFRETTTIGVRYREVDRHVLRRDWVTVTTSLGPVRVKQAWYDGQVVNVAPEFDDCAAIAQSSGTPVKDVQAAALVAYRASQERTNAS